MPEETSWLLIAVYLGAGFLLLAKGADWLVGGSTSVARRLGVSTLVIGLTVIAFGTSAPEIVVSGLAAWQGKSDISLGNVLGSNIANIGLVLGACAVVLPRVLEAHLRPRELFWLFASLAILWVSASDRAITRLEALFLFTVFVVYNLNVLLSARGVTGVPDAEEQDESKGPILWVFAGLVAISVGAWLVVQGAESGAYRLGVPRSVVALTVVAVGTSLPELAAGLGGAFRGESDISLGNVVGSNVFNLLAVIGIVGLIQPLDPDHPRIENPAGVKETFDKVLSEDFFVVLGFSLAVVILPGIGHYKGGRVKGIFLLVAYAGYCFWLFKSR